METQDSTEKAYEVNILNQTFRLKTDSSKEYVQRIADFVNEKMFNIQHRTQSVSSLNIAILTALNIADDYFKMKYKHRDRFELKPEGGENYSEMKQRVCGLLFELESKHKGKKILMVTHESPIFMMVAGAKGLDNKQALDLRGDKEFIENAKILDLDLISIPKNL